MNYTGPNAIQLFNKLIQCLTDYVHSNHSIKIVQTNKRYDYTSANEPNVLDKKSFVFEYYRLEHIGMSNQEVQIFYFQLPQPTVQLSIVNMTTPSRGIYLTLSDTLICNNIEKFLPVFIEAADGTAQRIHCLSHEEFKLNYDRNIRNERQEMLVTDAINQLKTRLISERLTPLHN